MLISSINHGVPNPVGMTEDFQAFWNKLPSYQFKTVAQRVRRLAFGHKGDAHQCYTGNARVSIYELRIRAVLVCGRTSQTWAVVRSFFAAEQNPLKDGICKKPLGFCKHIVNNV